MIIMRLFLIFLFLILFGESSLKSNQFNSLSRLKGKINQEIVRLEKSIAHAILKEPTDVDLLVKYREQFSLSQAVRYIAPFVLTFRGPCPEMEAPPISASMASIKLSNELKEDFLSKYAMLIGLAVALSQLTIGFFFYSRRSKG